MLHVYTFIIVYDNITTLLAEIDVWSYLLCIIYSSLVPRPHTQAPGNEAIISYSSYYTITCLLYIEQHSIFGLYVDSINDAT